MVENVVVKGEITAESVNALRCVSSIAEGRYRAPWDDIDAPLLERGPTRLLDVGGDLGQLISGELARPIGLDGLFDLAVCT